VRRKSQGPLSGERVAAAGEGALAHSCAAQRGRITPPETWGGAVPCARGISTWLYLGSVRIRSLTRISPDRGKGEGVGWGGRREKDEDSPARAAVPRYGLSP